MLSASYYQFFMVHITLHKFFFFNQCLCCSIFPLFAIDLKIEVEYRLVNMLMVLDPFWKYDGTNQQTVVGYEGSPWQEGLISRNNTLLESQWRRLQFVLSDSQEAIQDVNQAINEKDKYKEEKEALRPEIIIHGLARSPRTIVISKI